MKPDLHVLGGRFKVLSHLGGGGMAEVYLAEQVSLGRKVALKVLKRDLGKRPDMAERFRREAMILSTVDHPAVVRVIDFESRPEATILVLELAEGDTLEVVMKAGPLAPDRAIPILAQLAEGLGAIHEKGIVHRDIKPQNVVLTPTPRGDQARLLDFGIARLMEIPEAEGGLALPGPDNPFVSQPGQVVGTPAYVAPEQARAGPLDTRTDVYSFGVLAYRMLSGQFPFPGPGSTDFLKQHLFSVPRPLEEVMPGLKERPALLALVMDCLAKSPDARPGNGHALLERLMPMMPPNPYESSVTTPSRRMFNAVSANALSPVTTPVPAPEPEKTSKWAGVQERTALLGEAGLDHARRAIGAAQSVDREWWKSLIWTGVVVGAASAGWAMLPASPTQQAARMIETGAAEQALKLLDEREKEAPSEVPEISALKAAALHRLNRQTEERALLRERTYQALHAAHPLLLEALAEDFSQAESDAELRAMMAVVPSTSMQPAFEAFAIGPRSVKQWGALRYLDFTGAHAKLDRVDLYAKALSTKDCEVRAKASMRLSELGDLDAIDALRGLSELPKEEQQSGQFNCGQDEAAEAIRQLKKTNK